MISKFSVSSGWRYSGVYANIAFIVPIPSQMANFLINAHNSFTHNHCELGVDANGLPRQYCPLKILEKHVPGELHLGAVCDLAENSPAIASPGAQNVEIRANSASGGTIGSLYWPFSFWVSGFSDSMKLTHVDPYVFNVANDTIVSQESQEGGVLGETDSTLIHAQGGIWNIALTKPGITSSDTMASRAYDDLDSPVAGYFSSLPAVTSTMLGEPRLSGLGVGRGSIDQINFATQCANSGPMKQ